MSQDFMDAELFADFIIEAKEHLETIEPNLLELEKAPDNLGLLNEIFRPMHSLKGASGFLGLNRINQLAHKSENILDELRKGTMVVTSEIMDVILSSTDALRQIIDNLESTNSEGDVEIDHIKAQIDAIMAGESAKAAPSAHTPNSAPAPAPEPAQAPAPDSAQAPAPDSAQAPAPEPAQAPAPASAPDPEPVSAQPKSPAPISPAPVAASPAAENQETVPEAALPAPEAAPVPTEEVAMTTSTRNGVSVKDWIASLPIGDAYALTAFGEGHLKDFIDESFEIIEMLNGGLLRLEENPIGQDELVNDLFRFFHNLKGNSGIIGFQELNSLTHEAETLLNNIRKGEAIASHELIDLLLFVADVMESLVQGIDPVSGNVQPMDTSLVLVQLQQAVAGGPICLPAGLAQAQPEAAPAEEVAAPVEEKPDVEVVNPVILPVGTDGDDNDIFSVTVRQQIEIIHAAMSTLRKDGSHKESIDALYRCLVAIKNACSFVHYEEIKVYAERTAGIVETARSSDMDFGLMLDLLDQEVAIIKDMLLDKIAAVSKSLPAPENAAPAAPAPSSVTAPAQAPTTAPAPEASTAAEGPATAAAASAATVAAATATTEATITEPTITAAEAHAATEAHSGQPGLSTAEAPQKQAPAAAQASAPAASQATSPKSAQTAGKAEAPLSANAPAAAPRPTPPKIELTRPAPTNLPESSSSMPLIKQAPGSQGAQAAMAAASPAGKAAPSATAKPAPGAVGKPAPSPAPKAAAPSATAKPAPSAVGKAAPAKPGAPAPAAEAHKGSSTIRVDHEKLDHLMNLIGELIINRNRYTLIARSLEDGGQTVDVAAVAQSLSETTYAMARISDDLQDTIMKVRMVPVSSVFSRFPRLVRDLSRKSGKEVDLILEGEETELDKSVVEVIGDPLVHLIRNAVDHGVEAEADRVAKGKNPKGRVVLRAYHRGNSVAIEIEDDGKGIDPEKMREVAVRKGILNQEEARQLDDREAMELIFAPGFSSAETITDISGRGVGMDVVRTNIKNLKGSVSISSEVGKGTRFTLSLPLTLAIIDALMIKVAGQMYAIPLDAVSETTKIESVRLTDVKGRKAVTLRGEVIGIVELAEMLCLPRKPLPEMLSVVVIHDNQRRLGIVVDSLLERQEIVIKPLGAYLGDLNGISGATIMGDGSVILILDPHEVYMLATSKALPS